VLDFELDFQIQQWPLAEQIAFEKKVGMTVYKAWDTLPDEGQAFDVPALVVVGFAWIAARRKNHDLTFEQVAEQVSLEDFVTAMEALPEAEPPLENREQKRASGKSSRPSRSTAATRSSKSKA
jgi:hypothetical protein